MKFGNWYTITGKAVKRREWLGDSCKNTWERWPLIDYERCLYIGVRVVYDGIQHIGGDGYYEGFRVIKPITMCLFVDGPRRAPFYVFPDQVMEDDGA